MEPQLCSAYSATYFVSTASLCTGYCGNDITVHCLSVTVIIMLLRRTLLYRMLFTDKAYVRALNCIVFVSIAFLLTLAAFVSLE